MVEYPSGSLWYRISKSRATNADGVIGSDVTIGSLSGGRPYTGTWTRSKYAAPGTYFWQAYAIDCFAPSYPDCYIESPIWSFELAPYPAPSPIAPADNAAYRLGAPITFVAGDSRPGARVLLRMSRSAARDSQGLIGTDVEPDQLLSGGPGYSRTWSGSGTKGAGTYYWQAYRDDCGATSYPGCKRGGPVLTLRVTPATARLSVAGGCYREQTLIPVAGSGFERGAQVDLGIEDGATKMTTAGTAGAISTRVRAPDLPSRPGWTDEWLSAQERANRYNRTSLRVRVVAIAANITPASGVRRGQKVRHTVSGLPSGRAVYAHYMLGGRVRGHRMLGRAQGPCGMLSARAEMIPARLLRTGVWTVQYDTRPAYSSRTSPQARVRIGVTRVVVSSRAA